MKSTNNMKALLSRQYRTLIVVLVSVLLFYSCSTGQKQRNERKAVTRQVSGTVMNVKDLEGYRIVGIHGDYLFLKEIRDTSRLVVYCIEGDSLIRFKGLINKGRGPREFIYPEYAFSSDTLFVSNSDPGGIRAIYGIPLNDMSKIDDIHLWSEHSFHDQNLMTGLGFVPYGKGKFFVAAGRPETRQIFSLADFGKGETMPLQFWPRDSTACPLHCKQMVYMQAKLCVKDEQILYASMNARYMFLGKVQAGKFEVSSYIYSHQPQYKVMPDENVRYLKSGEYGIQPYATDQYIYAKVGHAVQDVEYDGTYKGFPYNYVDQVEVYDWQGSFIDNYQTDVPFNSFAVSDDNRKLYTLTDDLETKEPMILRYELSR